ncbi:MAG TPA: phage portal protein [Gaiellaceae bacterium]|nr:phage portal protein [Gaiellaceae bacterium]
MRSRAVQLPTTRPQLLDAAGRPIVSASSSSSVTAPRGPSYPGGGHGRRFTGFPSSATGVNTALLGNLEVMRDRSRALLRSSPRIKKAVRAYRANVVGTGIKPRSQVKDRALRDQIHELFNDWQEDADAAGRTDFYGLQSLGIQTYMPSGEVFYRFRPRRPEDGFAVPLQIECLEPDFCPIWYSATAPNGNMVRAGVEFDGIGRRTAYWMYRSHPGEFGPWTLGGLMGQLDLVRVPASEVLHLYEVTRPGQIRGEPPLATVLIRAHDKEIYDDAQMMRQKIGALFAAMVSTPEENALGETDAGDGTADLTLEPGIVGKLPPGSDVTFSNPPQLGTEYAKFQREVNLDICGGIGVTYEQGTGDMTGVNYSSARVALLDFRREVTQFIFNVLVPAFCRPVWRRWMTDAVTSGALTIPGFEKNPRPFLRATWTPQGWQWVDPIKEAESAKMSVRCGFTSRDDQIVEQGDDPEELDERIAAGQKRADALGLVFDSDPRQTAPGNISGAALGADAGEAPPAEQPQGDEQAPSSSVPATAPKKKKGKVAA